MYRLEERGLFIDNCIHWLTGTRPGSALHELWKEIGALGDDVELYEKEMFFHLNWMDRH